jgi:hypothetical protein
MEALGLVATFFGAVQVAILTASEQSKLYDIALS